MRMDMEVRFSPLRLIGTKLGPRPSYSQQGVHSISIQVAHISLALQTYAHAAEPDVISGSRGLRSHRRVVCARAGEALEGGIFLHGRPVLFRGKLACHQTFAVPPDPDRRPRAVTASDRSHGLRA